MISRTMLRKASRLAATIALGPWSWKKRLPFGVSRIAARRVWSGTGAPGGAMPRVRAYEPVSSAVVAGMPLTLKCWTLGVTGLPLGEENCDCQRVMFASADPPCPWPK